MPIQMTFKGRALLNSLFHTAHALASDARAITVLQAITCHEYEILRKVFE